MSNPNSCAPSSPSGSRASSARAGPGQARPGPHGRPGERDGRGGQPRRRRRAGACYRGGTVQRRAGFEGQTVSSSRTVPGRRGSWSTAGALRRTDGRVDVGRAEPPRGKGTMGGSSVSEGGHGTCAHGCPGDHAVPRRREISEPSLHVPAGAGSLGPRRRQCGVASGLLCRKRAAGGIAMSAAPGPSDRQAGEHPIVVPLRRLDARALPMAGGKGANLGELIQAGLPVPEGFCVTTGAYDDMATAAGLTEIIDRFTTTSEDESRSVELALWARERILSTPMPSHVAEAITAAYRDLPENASVAVRSSATAEDLPFASFAGQQDTYLAIVGEDAVLDAVHRCWASLWTDRAVVYRMRAGVDQVGTRLAVVVQGMVEAAVAGVLFTADPVTGHRAHTVIDASPGLGEAVVSGAVNR